MCRGIMNTEQIQKNQKIYTQKHNALRGLPDRIGTGNISLHACGSFQDFEIFEHPDKGLKLPYHFLRYGRVWTEKGRYEDTESDSGADCQKNYVPYGRADETSEIPRKPFYLQLSVLWCGTYRLGAAV